MNADLREIAITVAIDAAGLVRRRRTELSGGEALTATASTKSSAVDPVTVVDRESESFITKQILAARPEDGLVGEEGASISSRSGIRWIVDPIDGTVNFLYGIARCAISIAAARGDDVIAGAVVDVPSGAVYSAHRGGGAHVDRGEGARKLRVSGASSLSTALVATGFSYSRQWRAQQAAILTHVLPNVRDIRRMGSAALDLCALAEGSVDAYYEHATHPWDYAAGSLIAQEAGAVVIHPGLDASGDAGAITFGAAPGIRRELGNLLRECAADQPLEPAG